MFAPVSLAARYIFTRQLAALLTGRLQLSVAIDNLTAEMPKGRFRNVLDRVAYDVAAGRDFADALQDHPKVFGPVYVGVVRSGMRSGRIAEAMEQLSAYLEQLDAFSRKARTALAYPGFVIGSFLIVFHMMIFMILPRFAQMYRGMNRELPAPTQFLIGLGEAYAGNLILLAIAVGLVVGLIAIWMSNESGKIVWDAVKLKLPIVGGVVRHASMARFLRTVGMQLRHGIPAVEALRIGASAVANRQVAAAVRTAAERIERGASFADSFRSDPVFGDVVVRMIASGERAGTLDQLMLSAAEYFDTLLMQRITALTAMINPILTALVGLGTAGMLIAAFLPVFELSGRVT